MQTHIIFTPLPLTLPVNAPISPSPYFPSLTNPLSRILTFLFYFSISFVVTYEYLSMHFLSHILSFLPFRYVHVQDLLLTLSAYCSLVSICLFSLSLFVYYLLNDHADTPYLNIFFPFLLIKYAYTLRLRLYSYTAFCLPLPYILHSYYILSSFPISSFLTGTPFCLPFPSSFLLVLHFVFLSLSRISSNQISFTAFSNPPWGTPRYPRPPPRPNDSLPGAAH